MRNYFKKKRLQVKGRGLNRWKKEVLNKWKDHFEELLIPAGVEISQEVRIDNEEWEAMDCLSPEEIVNIMKKLKKTTFRYPGHDGLSSELFKYGSEALLRVIANLLQEVWYREEMTKDWSATIICPIYKKGDNTF